MNYSDLLDDLNPAGGLIVDSGFYKFMANGGYDDDRIDAKLKYLKETFGFIRGEDRVSEEMISRLNAIHSQYFLDEIKLGLVEADKREKENMGALGGARFL